MSLSTSSNKASRSSSNPLHVMRGPDPRIHRFRWMEGQALRRGLRQQAAHDFWVTLNGQQQRASRRIRNAAMLLPIAQGTDGEVERRREFGLRHPEAPSQYLDARHAAHPGQAATA